MITIATRKSPLARIQAEKASHLLASALPKESFQLLPLSTEIDSRLDYSLEMQAGIGLFTKELDQALLNKTADIAIHSAKDLPILLDDSLVIAGYLARDSVFDCLVSNKPWQSITRIATSSPRRRQQLKAIFPKAEFQLIRGNVETRLKKITNGEADATLLAEAGLDRLEICEYEGLSFTNLELDLMVPAAGQGAIAVVCRTGDESLYRPHLCDICFTQVSLEKACLKILDGGCQSPAGLYYDGMNLHIFHPSIAYQIIHLEGSTAAEREAYAIEQIHSIKQAITD